MKTINLEKTEGQISNRLFGIIFSIFFIGIGLYVFFIKGKLSVAFFSIAIIFLILSLLNSKILTPIKNIWIKFGTIMGKIISMIFLSFLYFLIITPIGLLMRIINKDILKLKIISNRKTFWNKKIYKSSMKDQF